MIPGVHVQGRSIHEQELTHVLIPYDPGYGQGRAVLDILPCALDHIAQGDKARQEMCQSNMAYNPYP